MQVEWIGGRLYLTVTDDRDIRRLNESDEFRFAIRGRFFPSIGKYPMPSTYYMEISIP